MNPGTTSRMAPAGNGSRGFTLIELLVVIAIVGILAGLIVSAAGMMTSKARRSRVEAERATLMSAIEGFRKAKGYYPPDNPNNSALSPLFYELTGAIYNTNNPANPYFESVVTQGQLFPANVQSIFGRLGFVNASPDRTELKDFLQSVNKSGRMGTFTTNAVSYVVLGVAVPGPQARDSNEGKRISPWNYVTTNPTNNSDGYDLWLDVTYSGRVNRISNWSKDPEVIQ